MSSIPRQRDVWDVNALHRTTEFVPLDVDSLPRYTQAATVHAGAADLLAHALMEEVDARLAMAGYDLDSPILDAPDLRDVSNEAISAAEMLGLMALDPEVPELVTHARSKSTRLNSSHITLSRMPSSA